MATNDGKFFRGIVGNAIFRVLNGKQIVQQREAPGTRKQSDETKKNSNTFGMAATLGAQIRRTMATKIIQNVDSTVASRLSGQLTSILSAHRDKKTMLYDWQPNSFETLEGFNFNPKIRLSKRLDTLPGISLKDEILTVAFPEISMPGILKFPFNSFRCKLSTSVSLLRLTDGKMVQRCQLQEKMMEKAISLYPAFKFKFQVPNGCFYVVSLWLDYEIITPSGNKTLQQPHLHAAAICQARIAEGQYTATDRLNWIEMQSY
jgi:hypothetical protein